MSNLYAKRTNNYGVNTSVDLDPTAVASSNPTVNNKIIIETSRGAAREEELEVNYPPVDPPEVQPKIQSRATENIETVEDKLLRIYSDILLSQNKTLLTNILSKSAIILSKSDLESVISIKVGHTCTIQLAETKVGCFAKANILNKIEQIVIMQEDVAVDFKYVYNSDYRILQDKYHISMSYVC
jgi:hypothetical protein